MKGTPHFAPWQEDPDPPDYWEDVDYERMRRRLRAYWDGEDYSDALVPFEELKHPRGKGGKWTEAGFDEKLRALGVGMHGQNFDRYKIRAIYAKELGRAKRGMGIEEMVTAILEAREGENIDPKYLPPIPDTFTPHDPPTPGEKEIVDSGDPITRPREKSPEFQDERDAFKRDLPIYDQHVNQNTTYTFMATPKGIATFTLTDVYGVDEPTVELHWLVAHDRGAGRSALELMAKQADKHGVTVQGYAVPMSAAAGKTMSVAKLEKFYEQFGFKPVGRRDKDGYKKIVRAPQKVRDSLMPLFEEHEHPRGTGGKWTAKGASAKQRTERNRRAITALREVEQEEFVPQTETPEFKAWFGQSKLTDEDTGKPKVLYHATGKDFDEFKAGGFDPKISGPAIWVSPHAEKQPAFHNLKRRDKEGVIEDLRVIPVFVRMERPLTIDSPTMLDWARDVFAGGNKDFPQIMKPEWVAELRRDDEYDGVWFKGEKLGWGDFSDEVIVFDPNQAKSAIANKGTFSRTSNKLRDMLHDAGMWAEEKHERVPAGEGGGGRFGTVGIPLVWKQSRAIAALMGKDIPRQKTQPTPEQIAKELKLDLGAIKVGGDTWNKETAIRLETEYQLARPAMDQLLASYEKGPQEEPDENVGELYSASEGKLIKAGEPGYDKLLKAYKENAAQEEQEEKEYEGTPEPAEWDLLSDDVHDQIANEYYDKALNDYVESEVTSWQESGGALDEAKAALTQDNDWIIETVTDIVEGDDDEDDDEEEEGPEVIKVGKLMKPVPKKTGWKFSTTDIIDSISLDYNSNGEGSGKLKVTIDDDYLQKPIGVEQDPNQSEMALGEKDYSKYLTGAQRAELKIRITAAFEKQAEKNADNVEPPDFSDSAKEYMQENWESNMGDNEKYEWAKYNTSIINDLQEEYEKEYAEFEETGKSVPGGIIGIPDKFDPLNETSGEDYRKTQRIARQLSLDRALAVMNERKIEFGAGVVPMTALRRIDNQLWEAWKGSSTSEDGLLLQVATADELGGRLNDKTGKGGKVVLDKKKIAKEADQTFKSIGGYEGIKAYVRGKWEATQYLLDKADLDELELYRGIALDRDKYEQAQGEVEIVDGYQKATNLNIVRNGAASTSVKASVSNKWSSDDSRVVIRLHIPRTAAISIPAYGINVHSEAEVVVAGTAWKSWDAWLEEAPTFEKRKIAA